MTKKYLTPEQIKKLSLEEMNELTRRELTPLYTPKNTKCIHSLYYDWTGWASGKVILPDSIGEAIEKCSLSWEKDGFLLDKWKVKSDMIQILFTVNPEITPVLFSKRVKGRLDNALRKLGTPVKFSRKVGFRCLGENTREIVNSYVQKQVGKSDYVDSRFKDELRGYTVHNEKVDLSQPVTVAHGRYWFNIHLVLVVEDRRNPITQKRIFEKVKSTCFRIADKNGEAIARLAVMPDHIHISLKGNPKISPVEAGCSFLSNLAYVLGNNHCWNDEFYVGTFSEYALNEIK